MKKEFYSPILEEKYIKKMEENCYRAYGGKKDKPDKNGEYHNLDDGDNHIEADKILMSLLKELGYKKLVKKYDSLHKWFS